MINKNIFYKKTMNLWLLPGWSRLASHSHLKPFIALVNNYETFKFRKRSLRKHIFA